MRNYRKFILLLVVVSFSLVISVEAQRLLVGNPVMGDEMDADYLFAFTRATKLYVFGDYGNALNLYRECLKYEPGSAALNYQISLIYTKGGDIDNARVFARKAYVVDRKNEWYARQYGRLCQAIGLFDSAQIVYSGLLNGSSGDAGIYFILSGIMEKKGDYEGAITYLNRIESELGVTQEVTVNKARIYSENGQMKTALVELRRALALNPEDYIIRGVMAEMFRDNNKPDSADFYYRSIINGHADDANVVFSFAEFLLGEKRELEAKSLYLHAFDNKLIDQGVKLNYLYNAIQNNQMFVKLSPVLDTLVVFYYAENQGDIRIMALYSDYYYRKGVYQKSIPVLKKIIEINDGNYSAWEQLLFCYNGMGQGDSVLLSGRQTIGKFPEEPMPYLLSASVLYGKKQYKPAIELLQQAIPIAENSRIESNVMALLAECYGRSGQYNLSDQMYERASQVDSTDIVMLNNYAYSLAERSVLLDKAELMSRKSIDGDRYNGTYLDTYGWVLYKQGRYAEAKKYLKQAIKLEGETNAEILSHLGDVYDKLNNYSKAVKFWKKALSWAEADMKIVLQEKLAKVSGR